VTTTVVLGVNSDTLNLVLCNFHCLIGELETLQVDVFQVDNCRQVLLGFSNAQKKGTQVGTRDL